LKKTPSILICAPSNTAIDEIVLRILTKGLLNSENEKFIPNIVRLGMSTDKKKHELVIAVTLECMIDQKDIDENNEKSEEMNCKELFDLRQLLKSIESTDHYMGQEVDINNCRAKI